MKKTCDICNKELGGFLSTKYNLKDGVVCDSCLLPFGVDAVKLKMADLGKAMQAATQVSVSDVKAAVEGNSEKHDEIRNILLQGTTNIKNGNAQSAKIENQNVKKDEDLTPEQLEKNKKILKWGLGSVLVVGIIAFVGIYLVMERGIFDSPPPTREPAPPIATVEQPAPTPEPTPIPTPEPEANVGNQEVTDEMADIREAIANVAENDIAQAWYMAFNALGATDFDFGRASGGILHIEHHYLIDDFTMYRFLDISRNIIYLMHYTWLSTFDIHLQTPRNETDLANGAVFSSFYISIRSESFDGVNLMDLDFYEFLALATEKNMTDFRRQEEASGARDKPAWAVTYIVEDEIVLMERRVRTAWSIDALFRGMYTDIMFSLQHAQNHYPNYSVIINLLDDIEFPDGRVEHDVVVMFAMFTAEDAQNADIRYLQASPERVRYVATMFDVHQAYRR